MREIKNGNVCLKQLLCSLLKLPSMYSDANAYTYMCACLLVLSHVVFTSAVARMVSHKRDAAFYTSHSILCHYSLSILSVITRISPCIRENHKRREACTK